MVHCPAEKVLKWDPYAAENCDTNAEFTIDHLNYGNPDWTATVKIYDACGALIRTLVQEGGFQVGENSVEWDGSLEPPPYGPGGTAPKGLYTYTVEAVHTEGSPYWPNEMCKDKDKSAHLEISNVALCQWDVSLEAEQITAKVRYTLNVAAGSVSLRLFSPDFTILAQVSDLPTSAGTRETPEFVFDLPAGTEAAGYYTAVVCATETAAMGQQYNRDGQPKAARQGLGTVEVRPLSKNWRGTDLQWGENLEEWQETPHQGKRYEAYATPSLPTNATLWDALHDSELLMLESHSNGRGGNQWIAPGSGVLCGKRYPDFDPQKDLALSDFAQNEASQLYFVNFVGCATALDDEDYGCLIDAGFTAGANITAGFSGHPSGGLASGIWVNSFYYYACVLGCTLYDAQDQAKEDVKAYYQDYCDYDTYFLKPWYRRDDRLVPARFGTAN